jgi:integrase
LKPFSINLYITTLRGFFAWAEEEKIHPDVARRVKGEKIAKGFKKEPLTRDQAIELVNSTESKRDKALVFLMIATGLRTIEVTGANVGDLKPHQGETVLYIQGKGHSEKDDFVVVKASVLRELQEYLVERRAKPEEPLFTSEARNHKGERIHPGSVSRIVKGALRGILIDDPRITAHSLRHSMVTFAGLGGASMESRQAGARHEQQATTALYDHSRNDLKLKDEAATCVLEYMGASI